MKKLVVLAVAVAFGFAVNASAEDVMKSKTEVKGDTTKTVTEVKNTDTGAKAKREVTTTATETTTTTDVKGKNVKMEKTTVDTAAGETGKVNVAVKKGAIEDMKINWTYGKEKDMFVIAYTIQDKANTKLLKELNLTPDQAKAIVPGEHKIYSTSEFTADDVRNNLRAVILKDIANTVNKQKMTK